MNDVEMEHDRNENPSYPLSVEGPYQRKKKALQHRVDDESER
jgi:hypothetical protein